MDRSRVGALALNEFGYQRATVDVDVLLGPEGLELWQAVHEHPDDQPG